MQSFNLETTNRILRAHSTVARGAKMTRPFSEPVAIDAAGHLLHFQIVKRWACLVCINLLAGCCHLETRGHVEIQKSLEEVVDAVQYAIDIAAKEKVWEATAKEIEHWEAACKKAREVAQAGCRDLLVYADAICQSWCKAGNCGYVHEQRCKALLEAKQDNFACLDAKGQQAAWCKAAAACAPARGSAAEACRNAGSIAVPQLKEAVLSLAIQRTGEASAGLDVLVVSFGGSISQIATNTIGMTLRPRVRSKDYGSDDLPAMPAPRIVPESTMSVANDLATLIISAVKASVKEYDKQNAAARPPTALANLEIEFSLVVDKSGNLGIKKTWDALSVGIDLSGKTGLNTTNTLKITYARED